MCLLAPGLLLRAALIAFPRVGDDDTDVYLELGQNLLRHGTYGMMSDGELSPSLFRLPGYPLVLAGLGGHLGLVLAVQTAFDLLGCVLLGLTVRRLAGARAGLWTLGLASLCPFTAVYAATPLTESLSVFAVSLAIFGMERLLSAWHTGTAARGPVAMLAGAAALAMLLRPDGVLLTVSVVFATAWYGARRMGFWRGVRVAAAVAALAVLPLVPWTVRNLRTFHVFQPIAPRHVNDPGERVNLGFYRWMRTWAAEYSTTVDVYWHVGSQPIALANLPPRAFDSPAERDETAALLRRYNERDDLDQPLDDAFAALAARRIRASPARYYLWLPALRVLDMTLRPRTDGFGVAADWWHWRRHRSDSLFAAASALVGLLYFALAAIAALRRRIPLAALMGAYLLLRCLLLAGVENAEPRYTLELLPIVFVCAGIGLSSRPRRGRPGAEQNGTELTGAELTGTERPLPNRSLSRRNPPGAEPETLR